MYLCKYTCIVLCVLNIDNMLDPYLRNPCKNPFI